MKDDRSQMLHAIGAAEVAPLPLVEAALSWAYQQGYWPGPVNDTAGALRAAAQYAKAHGRRVVLAESGKSAWLEFCAVDAAPQAGDLIRWKDGRTGSIYAAGAVAYHVRLRAGAGPWTNDQGTAADFTFAALA